MRKVRLALALLLLGLAAPAAAHDDAPAMTASEWSFELFGTSFCVGEATGASCDVSFDREEHAMAPAVPGDGARPLRVLGLSICTVDQAQTTGPACDLIWRMPDPAAAWRDFPEIRLLVALGP
jgi:hypothetical protein